MRGQAPLRRAAPPAGRLPFSGTQDGLAGVGAESVVVAGLDRVGWLDLVRAHRRTDLIVLLGARRTCAGDPGYDPAADLDGSGCIDLSDLATLLPNYGAGA